MQPHKVNSDFNGMISFKYTLKRAFVKTEPVEVEMIAFITRLIHDLIYLHPIHTLIVHFPIALVSSALFFLLLAIWKKSDLLEQIAFADIALASVSTVVAGIAGIRDNAMFYHNLAPNHTVKIILASVLLLVTGATAIWRWRNPKLFHSPSRWLYISAYVLSFLLVTVLGFLGGVIVYGF